jgi:hypothetical protein
MDAPPSKAKVLGFNYFSLYIYMCRRRVRSVATVATRLVLPLNGLSALLVFPFSPMHPFKELCIWFCRRWTLMYAFLLFACFLVIINWFKLYISMVFCKRYSYQVDLMHGSILWFPSGYGGWLQWLWLSLPDMVHSVSWPVLGYGWEADDFSPLTAPVPPGASKR